MPSDPFVFVSPADERVIQQARKRGPKALDRVTKALARKAIDLANRKDQQRERELADEVDRNWPPRFLQGKSK
jgi:hypothetical protein